VRRFYFLAQSIGLLIYSTCFSACSLYFGVFGPTSIQLAATNPPVTNTCIPLSATLVGIAGDSIQNLKTLNLNFTGLGSGQLYKSESDCQNGQSNFVTFPVPAGQGNISLFFRDSLNESVTINVQSPTLQTVSITLSMSTVTELGQKDVVSHLQYLYGINPGGFAADATHFALADAGNNRVLIWNSPNLPSGPPSVILGQPDFTSIDGNHGGLSASSLLVPASVSLSGGKLYVADGGNSRILIWNAIPAVNNTPPDWVLGQPSFLTNQSNFGGAGPTGSNMWYPDWVFVQAGEIFVSDYDNNRILVWSTPITSMDQSADFALGQTDLNSSFSDFPSISGSGLFAPRAVISDGTKLYVADSANNRVLVWNTLPTMSGQSADFAIGQPDLVSNSPNNGGLSASSLYYPDSITTDGSRLYIGDQFNTRVLGWNTLPTTSGAAADLVLGQTNFTSSTFSGRNSATLFGEPAAVLLANSQLYLADNSERIVGWSVPPSMTGQAANLLFGQPTFNSRIPDNAGASASTLQSPNSVFSVANKLFVADSANNRVLIWNTIPSANDQAADVVLGHPDFTGQAPNAGGVISATSFYSPCAVYSDGIHLVVADTGDNRVLIWNTIPVTNGQAPDLVLGQSNFVSGAFNAGGSASASTLAQPRGIYIHSGELFVADPSNNRVLIWNSFPSVNGQAADVVIGQTTLTQAVVNSGGLSASSLWQPMSITGFNGQIAVADTDNNRVLIWNSVPSVNGQLADVVIGQASFSANGANSGGLGAASLYQPGAVFMESGMLVVSDTVNNRVLAWASIPATSFTAAASVYGQPGFTSNLLNNGGLSGSSLFKPAGVWSDRLRIFICDASNDRIMVNVLAGD
jgi:hypothetical protein